jgi:hypothetical protein
MNYRIRIDSIPRPVWIYAVWIYVFFFGTPKDIVPDYIGSPLYLVFTWFTITIRNISVTKGDETISCNSTESFGAGFEDLVADQDRCQWEC